MSDLVVLERDVTQVTAVTGPASLTTIATYYPNLPQYGDCACNVLVRAHGRADGTNKMFRVVFDVNIGYAGGVYELSGTTPLILTAHAATFGAVSADVAMSGDALIVRATCANAVNVSRMLSIFNHSMVS